VNRAREVLFVALTDEEWGAISREHRNFEDITVASTKLATTRFVESDDGTVVTRARNPVR